MKTKALGLVARVALLGMLSVGPAAADVYTTFDVTAPSSPLSLNPTWILNGTFTLDDTLGTVTAYSLTVTGAPAPQKFFSGTTPDVQLFQNGPQVLQFDVANASSYRLALQICNLDLLCPAVTSTTFTGGVFNDWAFTNSAGNIIGDGSGGTITPSAVPLPASAWLMLSGLVGVGVMGRK
jgi:hypothetical protein